MIEDTSIYAKCKDDAPKDEPTMMLHPAGSESHCRTDECGCHHPLRLWSIKYTVVGVPKYKGVAVVQAKDLCSAEMVFIQDSKFNGFREYIKINCIEEIYPDPAPCILMEDSASVVDRQILKSYPFPLKDEFQETVTDIYKNITVMKDSNQVNADWNETDENSKAYILNKPEIPDAQVQADWNETNESSKSFIQNKPTIPEAQVNADWESKSGKSQILNKPTDLVHTSDIEGLLKNDGTVYTGKYLEQVQDLDNFQASEGKIAQYIGETNSKYTNSYIYKKVGTKTTIPVGTDYIRVNYNSNLKLGDVGIEKGIYYKTDKKDEITSNIRDFFLLQCSTNGTGVVTVSRIGVSNPVYSVKTGVYAFHSINNKLYFDKVTHVTYETVQGVLTPREITLANGNRMLNMSIVFIGNAYSGVEQGELIPESKIIIFENILGQKIYCISTSGTALSSYKYKLLVLNNMGDYYQVANPDGNWVYNSEFFSNGTTTEEQTIDDVKWQQCVPPEEDTSHYVLDSDIGWIEH